MQILGTAVVNWNNIDYSTIQTLRAIMAAIDPMYFELVDSIYLELKARYFGLVNPTLTGGEPQIATVFKEYMHNRWYSLDKKTRQHLRGVESHLEAALTHMADTAGDSFFASNGGDIFEVQELALFSLVRLQKIFSSPISPICSHFKV